MLVIMLKRCRFMYAKSFPLTSEVYAEKKNLLVN